MSTTVFISVIVVTAMCLVGLLLFMLRLVAQLRQLSSAFAKLGFVLREDAKMYFEEASERLLDTNAEFKRSYMKIVEDGTKGALSQAAYTVEGSIVAAQQEANKIILQARDDARRINIEAKRMAVDEMSRTLDNAADTISWVMERYVGETFTLDQHRYVIEKLLEEYLHEYQR